MSVKDWDPKGAERVREMIEWLPPEAKKAFETGGKWEYEPETVEAGTAWVSYDDRWELIHLVQGFRVEDHQLYETVYTVDQDGNWDFSEEYNVGEVGYEKWVKQHSYEESRKGWCDYYEHVAETGEDPLGEFMLGGRREVEWKVVVRQVEGGVELVKGRRSKGGKWVPWNKLPQDIQSFFYWDNPGPLIDPEFKTLESLLKPKTAEWKRISEDEAEGIVKIMMDFPASVEEYKKAGRKALRNEKCKQIRR